MREFIVAGVVIGAWLAFATAGAKPDDIAGRWEAEDGSAVVRLEPCADRDQVLCAVVESDIPEPGEASLVGQIVLRDMRPDGVGRWKGRYVDGVESYAATLKLDKADEVIFKICIAPFVCESERYLRVAM